MRTPLILLMLALASPAWAEPFEWRIDFRFRVTDIITTLDDGTLPPGLNPSAEFGLGDRFTGSFLFSTHTEDPEDLMGPGAWGLTFAGMPPSAQSFFDFAISPQELDLDVHKTSHHISHFELGVEIGPQTIDIDDDLLVLGFLWFDDEGQSGRQRVFASTQTGPLHRVPEPSTLLLFGSGILGVALRRRR
jgi:hypothetical protein